MQYEAQKPTDAELENRFRYHPPKTPSRLQKHQQVTDLTLELAKRLRDICPAGRCLAQTLTDIENARMHANQALATESPTDD